MKSSTKNPFASVANASCRRPEVDRGSADELREPRERERLRDGASTGAKIGHQGLAEQRVEPRSMRASTVASPTAVGKYSWVLLDVEQCPPYSPEPVFSNTEAVARKAVRFGWISRFKLKWGGRRIGTGRGLPGSSSRFWTIATCCDSSAKISFHQGRRQPGELPRRGGEAPRGRRRQNSRYGHGGRRHRGAKEVRREGDVVSAGWDGLRSLMRKLLEERTVGANLPTPTT